MRDADWEYLLDNSALEHHSLNQKSMLFQPYHTAIGSTLAVRGTSNRVVLGPFSGRQKTWMDTTGITMSVPV